MEQLVNGESTVIGGKTIQILAESHRKFLLSIALNLPRLQDKKGADLAADVEHSLTKVPELIITGTLPDRTNDQHRRKLKTIRVKSFRGVAPAGQIWEYDFEEHSHLLHGPNGSGKSSLFGSLCWAFTGRLFRDDGPPSTPQDVPCYSRAKKSKVEGTRPDALSLLTTDGSLLPSSDDYTVELQLVSGKDPSDSLWLRRRSSDGLWRSDDGQGWMSVGSIEELGLSALDVDLQILMPAKLSHLKFGKDSEVLSIFSQIVGLDDLEKIADIAAKCGTVYTKQANTIEKEELKATTSQIDATIAEIAQTVPDYAKAIAGYAQALANDRTSKHIASYISEVKRRLTELTKQLAVDIGITIPEPGSPDSLEVEKQLELLPGHIDSATAALGLSIEQLFANSVGYKLRDSSSIKVEHEALATFQATAVRHIHERLSWAQKEKLSAKAALMLIAAEHFPSDGTNCPVCSQGLREVPEVRRQLSDLRTLAGQSHLRQEIADLERALVADLDKIVPNARRENLSGLDLRLRADWNTIKKTRFLGLVAKLSARFEDPVESLAISLRGSEVANIPLVDTEQRSEFPKAFATLEKELRDAYQANALDLNRLSRDQELRTTLSATLLTGPSSLLGVLLRGGETNSRIQELTRLQSQLAALHSATASAETHRARIVQLRELSSAAAAIKILEGDVRQETIDVVKEVEPLMKGYYEKLYDTEHLALDLITPGHSANPEVKDEFNVYFRAGDSRLPVGPFANAGRLRALTLCFAFALLGRRRGTLSLLLFDDPALSLDDEHKAKFIDHLVGPFLPTDQVLLATHYELFFKCAEPLFLQGRRLQLAPRRTREDAVAFEPADLLDRIEATLKSGTTMWREVANNIRRWGERTLATLSGYSPIPFVVFNNIPLTVSNYAGIKDERIATQNRDKLVLTMRSPQFLRVMHKLAHDEVVVEADVRDALREIGKCRESTAAEIERFRTIQRHELVKRSISPRPILDILSIPHAITPISVPISGRAAAASNGVGITWIESEALNIPACSAAIVRTDYLAPIANVGHFALLDVSDSAPGEGDLVAVRTEKKETFLRRLWRHDGLVNLEATNPICPHPPAVIAANSCEVRRIVGVLFEGVNAKSGSVGDEWAVCNPMKPERYADIRGIRVDGTSLEPIARDGQIVLVRQVSNIKDLDKGELACIDLEDTGAVLKRCYLAGKQAILCPVNPVDFEEPIIASVSKVLSVYRIVGVVFEEFSDAS